jgi:hypothetical protein
MADIFSTESEAKSSAKIETKAGRDELQYPKKEMIPSSLLVQARYVFPT